MEQRLYSYKVGLSWKKFLEGKLFNQELREITDIHWWQRNRNSLLVTEKMWRKTLMHRLIIIE